MLCSVTVLSMTGCEQPRRFPLQRGPREAGELQGRAAATSLLGTRCGPWGAALRAPLIEQLCPNLRQLLRASGRPRWSLWRQRWAVSPAGAGGSGRSGGGRVSKGGARCHVSAGPERCGRQGLSWERPQLRPGPAMGVERSGVAGAERSCRGGGPREAPGPWPSS